MKRAILLAGAVLLLVFALSGVALADAATWHTPQDIYNDFADNGKLDGPGAPYTDEELEAYLNDATIHQYGDPTIVAALDQLVRDLLGTDEFPMTGAQIALIAVIAVVLIGGGFLLRRMSRKRT
jgi:LPXTG-motif cell wall-anchored protein